MCAAHLSARLPPAPVRLVAPAGRPPVPIRPSCKPRPLRLPPARAAARPQRKRPSRRPAAAPAAQDAHGRVARQPQQIQTCADLEEHARSVGNSQWVTVEIRAIFVCSTHLSGYQRVAATAQLARTVGFVLFGQRACIAVVLGGAGKGGAALGGGYPQHVPCRSNSKRVFALCLFFLRFVSTCTLQHRSTSISFTEQRRKRTRSVATHLMLPPSLSRPEDRPRRGAPGTDPHPPALCRQWRSHRGPRSTAGHGRPQLDCCTARRTMRQPARNG